MHEIDKTEARKALIATANTLRQCLLDINRWGDAVGATLAYQSDGCAYGEVFDGLKVLVKALYPEGNQAEQIIDAMYDNDMTVEEADEYVYDRNAPMREYTAAEITEYLERYERWLLCLDDGVLNIEAVIGDGMNDPTRATRDYLNERIRECKSALAYRTVLRRI